MLGLNLRRRRPRRTPAFRDQLYLLTTVSRPAPPEKIVRGGGARREEKEALLETPTKNAGLQEGGELALGQ